MSEDTSGRAGSPGLRRVITVRHAVAIYISSVLGAGILVIPGLAAKAAGAGSLFAWALLSLASYPFAYTFSRLSARRPESGGIYSFAKEAFGRSVSTTTAWLFVAWVVLGAPAVTLAAGSYLAYAFPISGLGVFLAAAVMLLAAFAINIRGIRLSARVQLGVVATIVAVLSLAVVASAPDVRASNFTPLLPGGVASVGVASALILWSFLGYENVSNIAEEFENPERDFARSVTVSVVLVSALYLAVAFTVVGTGAFQAGGGVTPFAEMMSHVFGAFGGVAVSLFAVAIIFSTVNAYTAGMARIIYAAAKEGSLPRVLATVDPRTGAPRRALTALYLMIAPSLVAFYFLHVDLQSAFLVTSGAAILTYVVGSAAGIKLLRAKGAKRALPWVSLVVSLVILPFIGRLLVVSAVVAAAGLVYGRARGGPAGAQGIVGPGPAGSDKLPISEA